MKTSALVAAARTGDLRAFATLVERYYPMARATCARSPGDEDLALDVTQEAVVTAMLSLDRAPARRPVRRVADRDRAQPARKARTALRSSLGDLRPEAAGSRPERRETMADEGTTMVPVTISRVIISREALREGLMPPEGLGSERTETGHQVRRRANEHFIVLTDNGGNRALHIGAGPAEAIALGLTQSRQEFPRPMTYQFAASLLAGSGTGLREVRITSLTDGIFYAQAVLTNGAIIDARPSDAVNLAAITGAPVLVAAELLDLPTGPDHATTT
jgi:bifunctional DNase/RNase